MHFFNSLKFADFLISREFLSFVCLICKKLYCLLKTWIARICLRINLRYVCSYEAGSLFLFTFIFFLYLSFSLFNIHLACWRPRSEYESASTTSRTCRNSCRTRSVPWPGRSYIPSITSSRTSLTWRWWSWSRRSSLPPTSARFVCQRRMIC